MSNNFFKTALKSCRISDTNLSEFQLTKLGSLKCTKGLFLVIKPKKQN